MHSVLDRTVFLACTVNDEEVPLHEKKPARLFAGRSPSFELFLRSIEYRENLAESRFRSNRS